MNAVALQFQPQALVEHLDGELAGAIDGVGRDAAQSGEAAQGNERAPGLLDLRQGIMSQVERAQEVDAHHLLQRCQVRAVEVGAH